MLQRRSIWARLGRRTLVIVDLPYVHQLLEAYVSKKFALSYSIASLDVHGTDPLDHFVHSFTHRSFFYFVIIDKPCVVVCNASRFMLGH